MTLKRNMTLLILKMLQLKISIASGKKLGVRDVKKPKKNELAQLILSKHVEGQDSQSLAKDQSDYLLCVLC